ncbi:MAG: DNA mismatch repair protein MutT, partial [Clostridia bacterium]|nr:DNA mismatch repair protein MutT [Clostridia bacterium]
HLFTSDDFSGDLIDCDEGELKWVPIETVPSLPTWAGDKIFLQKILEKGPFFSLKLEYKGDILLTTTCREYGSAAR